MLVFFVMLSVVEGLLQQRVLGQDQRVWATYYGGNFNEDLDGFGPFVATDRAGNVYLAGMTTSTLGIAYNGFQSVYAGGTFSEGEGDGFLVKFDIHGNRKWATYYGGRYADKVSDLLVDKWGNVYMSGTTKSDTGIAWQGLSNTIGGGIGDAYLVKFDSLGNRLWATYYGGEDYDSGNNITTDTSGNIYLAGQTFSDTGIAYQGFLNTYQGVYPDAFLVKFDPMGNRLWATYFGGPGSDIAYAVATDTEGNVYLTGDTYSQSDIATPAFSNTLTLDGNAFLVKFNSSGSRIWGRYIGGNAVDLAYDIVTDASGNIYVAGETDSPTGIAYNGFDNTYNGGLYDDAYLIKFNPSGNRIWGTYYGDAETRDIALSLATDSYENIFMAGLSRSSSNIAFGGFQDSLQGSTNPYIVKLDKNGQRICSSYYGVGSCDGAYTALDDYGHVYLTGTSSSSTGIAYQGFQNTIGGGWPDAFLVQFTACLNPLSAEAEHINPDCNGQCNGTATVNPVFGILPYIYLWSDGQTTSTATSLCAGNYSVTVTDSAGNSTSVNVTLTQLLPITVNVNSSDFCNGQTGSATVTVSGGTPGYTYYWNTNPAQTNQTVTGLIAGNYEVTVFDINGCSNTQIFSIDTFNMEVSVTQSGDTLIASFSPNYQWYYNDTLIPGATQQTYVITQSGYYYVVTTQDGCNFTTNTIETTCLCVGIEENDFLKKISLFPNPFTTQLTITGYTPALIKLCNILGQTVAEAKNTNTLWPGNVPQGLYLLQLYDAKGALVKTGKIVKATE